MKKRRWERESLYFLIGILTITIICLWKIGIHKRILVVDDEFAYWGIAAHLAGLDWSGAMSKTEYYSFGYSFLLVPLYWLVKMGLNLSFIYRIAIGMNTVFLCLSFVLAVRIGKRLFPRVNSLSVYASALVSVLYVSNVIWSGWAWTEVCLVFVFWCCFYCIIRMVETPTRKWIVLTLLTTAYLFSVHMRMLGVVLAVCVVIFLRLLFNGQKTEPKKAVWTALGILLLVGVFLGIRYYVKSHIYLMGDTDVSVNDFYHQAAKGKMLFSVSGIVDLFLSVCGKVFYVGAASYCLGLFSLFVLLRKLFQICWNGLRERKWKPDNLFFLWVFLLLSAAGAVLVDAVFTVYPYYFSGKTSVRGDSIIYGRYVDFIIGPLILIGLLFLLEGLRYLTEMILTVPTLIGCGLVAQHLWDILIFYNGADVGLRANAVPGVAYMFSGSPERLSFLLMAWAFGGAAIFLLCYFSGKDSHKTVRTSIFCFFVALLFGFLGNQRIEQGTLEKANKDKDVDSVAGILSELDETESIYYVTGDGSVTTEMKILQWELPLKTIQLVKEESGYFTDTKAIYLASSADNSLNATLGSKGDYLYDSGLLSVYTAKESEIGTKLADVLETAKSSANPKPIEVNLKNAVAEWAYQKANGSVYLSNQRSEGYLTWQTDLVLPDGMYEFTVDMDISYDEGGELGHILLTNDCGTYEEVRTLAREDFDRSGNGKIRVRMPVRDHENPIVGVYTSGRSAIKVNGISCRQTMGNLPAELEREEDWEILSGKLTALWKERPLSICYVDTNASAQAGFPDFSTVNSLLPREISRYCTGDQLKNAEFEGANYFIIEKSPDVEAEDMQIFLEICGGMVLEETPYYCLVCRE